MVCHHTMTERSIKKHDTEKPFAPENGQELKFKIGDKIIYTNDYGVEWELTVTGFYKPEKTDALYAMGCRYMLDSDAYWFPHKESELRLRN